MKYGIHEYCGMDFSGYAPDDTFETFNEAFDAAVELVKGEEGGEIEVWVGPVNNDGYIEQHVTLKVENLDEYC